jgi:hypothetical protein
LKGHRYQAALFRIDAACRGVFAPVLEYAAPGTRLVIEMIMDEEVFNIQLRKFLKKVGIQSQREIEQAVRAGIDSGSLSGEEKLNASVLLRVPEVGVEITIEDDIALR